MTKKHFEAIAAVIKTQIDDASLSPLTELDFAARKSARQTAINIAKEFARIASSDNPRFDTRRFLLACGIKP